MQPSPNTRRFCVIGDPVSHSKSPLLQGAMFRALALNYEYLCQPVSSAELPGFLTAVRGGAFAGFNATMPHKEALIPLMDVLDESAARCGSVNTVCNKDGKLYGYSTDGDGFLRALEGIGFAPEGKRVTILGAGGAAKSVSLALKCAGVGRITLCNRSRERSDALADGFGIMVTSPLAEPALSAAMEGCDLLINCTSLGMDGGGGQFECFDFLQALPPLAPVCDLIYAPPETALLSAARAQGHATMNGLPLLLHQAILSLEHLAGVTLDRETMVPILERTLKTAVL